MSTAGLAVRARARTKEEMQAVRRNLTFIHKSGFTGGAQTYEDNLELAKIWLELGEKAE